MLTKRKINKYINYYINILYKAKYIYNFITTIIFLTTFAGISKENHTN